MVSALGLGGYHLGKVKSVREAIRLVHAAIDAGITFLDNAWEYHEHESEIRMGKAIADRRDRVFLMTKVCTHGRDAKVAMRQLEESLRRLQDRLSRPVAGPRVRLLQRSRSALRARRRHRGARSREARRARSASSASPGTRIPEIHLRMLSFGYPFDACQLPLNVFDASFRSFEQRVLPELQRQRDRADRDEEPAAHGEAVKKKVGDAGGRAALRDEPAGRRRRQRDRLDEVLKQNLADRVRASSR